MAKVEVMILIHTSVKLVTKYRGAHDALKEILIHTSVKLVTVARSTVVAWEKILIHTSVKLVTRNSNKDSVRHLHFNPHEREARDVEVPNWRKSEQAILIHTSVKLVTTPFAS